MMDSIRTFARAAAAQFHQEQQEREERFNLHLSPKVVENFIQSSYYASLISDENRWPYVCLKCYKKGSEKNCHILFDPPSDISPHEIAKISHAVADDCHIYCISDNGKLTIGGIALIYPHPDDRELGYSTFRLPNPLRLFIRGPGYIEISTTRIAKVYKSGRISEEFLLSNSSIMSQLELNIRQKMQSETHGTIEGLQSIFNDIAKAIVRLGHGGLLLIVDEYKESYFSSFRQIDSPLLQQPLIQYWDSAADLSAVAGSPGKVLNRPDRSETYDGRTLIVAANVEMLEKYIRTVSHLAGMDGAIVLDYRCKVVAFNAIIAKTEDRPQDYRFIAQDNVATKYEDVVKNKGSRHQSALSFVMRVPRSFAFVISQDSSISVFHNHDDGSIRCAQEMRVLDG